MAADPFDLNALLRGISARVNAALKENVMLVRRDAVRNAPRSPTQAQADKSKRQGYLDAARHKGLTIAQTLDTADAKMRRLKAQRKNRRKAGSHSRPKPGGLERSIKMETRLNASSWEKSEGAVFVEAQSEAGKYAAVIHNEKGVRWRKRGAGTVAKGARADEKFIERAVNDNAEKMNNNIANALGKAVEEYAAK